LTATVVSLKFSQRDARDTGNWLKADASKWVLCATLLRRLDRADAISQTLAERKRDT